MRKFFNMSCNKRDINVENVIELDYFDVLSYAYSPLFFEQLNATLEINKEGKMR